MLVEVEDGGQGLGGENVGAAGWTRRGRIWRVGADGGWRESAMGEEVGKGERGDHDDSD